MEYTNEAKLAEDANRGTKKNIFKIIKNFFKPKRKIRNPVNPFLRSFAKLFQRKYKQSNDSCNGINVTALEEVSNDSVPYRPSFSTSDRASPRLDRLAPKDKGPLSEPLNTGIHPDGFQPSLDLSFFQEPGNIKRASTTSSSFQLSGNVGNSTMSLALELGLPERSCETVRSSVELSGEESELVRASDVTLPAASNGPPSKNYATEDNRIVSLSSFTLLEHIGSGSWGRVLCVKQNEANSFHAMKVIDKTKLGPSNVMMVRQELKTLAELGLHPNLLRLDYAFQTYTHLFLVTELCHSDLLTYLEHQDYLDDNDVRTCASSVASAIDFLHNQNILHCDIKADNIMINLDQHKRIRMYKLGDFGVCREGNYFTGPCGTFTSMAPEVMQDINGYGLYVDWWSYGILLYHISVGCFPFSGETPRAVFDCIRATESKIRFPKRLSVIFMDLVTKLLILEPKERLGFNGAEEIQAHPFFQGVDWSEDTPPFEINYTPLTFAKPRVSIEAVNAADVHPRLRDVKGFYYDCTDYEWAVYG